MSDSRTDPDDAGAIAAEGTDPDLVSEESRPEPEERASAEEDEDGVDLSDLP